VSSLHADPLGPHSDVVSTARLLLESKGRRTSGNFLVEGPQNVSSAIDNGLAKYLLSVGDNEVVVEAQKNRLKVFRISESASKALSDTKTPQGIYAVCTTPENLLQDLSVNNFVIVLDRIADPGNVGTIIRTAAAFGADAVIALAGTADVWSGKVIRSTAGAFAEIKIFSAISEEELLHWSSKKGIETFALSGLGEVALSNADLQKPHAWLVGNEAGGLSQSLISSANLSVRIPMKPNVESLNAAMAVGICAFTSFTSQNK
jgi:TrmH family RNA methyltransferase